MSHLTWVRSKSSTEPHLRHLQAGKPWTRPLQGLSARKVLCLMQRRPVWLQRASYWYCAPFHFGVWTLWVGTRIHKNGPCKQDSVAGFVLFVREEDASLKTCILIFSHPRRFPSWALSQTQDIWVKGAVSNFSSFPLGILLQSELLIQLFSPSGC